MGFGAVNKQTKSHAITAPPNPSQTADCDGSLVANGWAVYTAWILKIKECLMFWGTDEDWGGVTMLLRTACKVKKNA